METGRHIPSPFTLRVFVAACSMHSNELGIALMMTRFFSLEEHVRIAILDGVGDGIDNGRATTGGTVLSHLDAGRCRIGFCRKNGVCVGVGVPVGGNPSHLRVVGVPVQTSKIFIEAQRHKGVGGDGGGGEKKEEGQGCAGSLHLVGLAIFDWRVLLYEYSSQSAHEDLPPMSFWLTSKDPEDGRSSWGRYLTRSTWITRFLFTDAASLLLMGRLRLTFFF